MRFDNGEAVSSSEGSDLLKLGGIGSIAAGVLLPGKSTAPGDGGVVPRGKIGQRRTGGVATHHDGDAESMGWVGGSEELVGEMAWTCTAGEGAVGT
jgi:hypothetical protein